MALLLILAAACGDDEPTAEPTSAPQEGGSQAGASDAATQAAQAAAEQGRVTAEAAQAAAEAAQAAAEGARQGEDRPTISVIGSYDSTASVSASASETGTGTGSVSASGTGTGSGSVSGTGTGSGSGTGSASGTGTGTGSASGTGTGNGSASGTATGYRAAAGETGGLTIPTNLSPETSGPTKSDGYYTPTTNREIYQKIATDYQELAKFTNVFKEGRPLPAAEISLLYEAGTHTRIGPQSRTLRSFATGTSPAKYFPESAEFYGSDSFLDDPIENAVRQRGEAEDYCDAQRRQAINKSALRILYHWSKFYMIIGGTYMRSGLVDESWAIYVVEEVDGGTPTRWQRPPLVAKATLAGRVRLTSLCVRPWTEPDRRLTKWMRQRTKLPPKTSTPA